MESDPIRKLNYREVVSNFDQLLAVAGPVMSMLGIFGLISSLILYKSFQRDISRRVYLKL